MTLKHILIADDDLAIVDSLSMALNDEGFKVSSASDGYIIEAVNEHHPDLILLDLWLRHVSGAEICCQLKINKKTKNIPIIMISANKEIAEIARESKADDFLAKPFDIDDLLQKINQLLI